MIIPSHFLFLLFCIYSVHSSKLSISHYLTELKPILFFYAEPFISGARVGEESLEGYSSLEMASKLVSSVESERLFKELDADSRLELELFRVALSKGTEAMKSLEEIVSTDFKDRVQGLIKIQNEIIFKLEVGEKVILPFGWQKLRSGHAVAIGIQKQPEDLYDLSIYNAGAGKEFHSFIPDPDGVYPFLTQLWVKFKGIPKDEIFDKSAWFLHALHAFQIAENVANIEFTTRSVALYFYGSFLANFRAYLIKDIDASKVMPVQRSGTCTLASLMAALLDHSSSVEQFHLHRVVMGQSLLRTFLQRPDVDDFKVLVNDGFQRSLRKLFLNVASSVAQHVYLYLEHAYPDYFKYAGLLGKDRSEWLKQKHPQAVSVLSTSKLSLGLVQQATDLSTQIIDFVLNAPIDENSTQIRIKKEFVVNQNLSLSFDDFDTSKIDLDQESPYEYLSAPVKRLWSPIKDAPTFLERFLALAQNVDKSKNIFTLALDVFRMTPQDDLLPFIESQSSENSLEIMRICQMISSKFLRTASPRTSLENFVLLGFLQLTAWKSALNYDSNARNVLGLKALSPPNFISNYLFEDKMKSATFWTIKISYNHRENMNSLQYLLEQFNKFTEDTVLAGPDEFKEKIGEQEEQIAIGTERMIFSKAFNKSSEATKVLYDQMGKIKEVSELFQSYCDRNSKWENTPHGLFTIILTNSPKLFDSFPHYYYFMDILFWNHQAMLYRADHNEYIDHFATAAKFEDCNPDSCLDLTFDKKPYSPYYDPIERYSKDPINITIQYWP